MYRWLVPHLVFPLYERLGGRKVWSEVTRLRALQWRSAEEIEARGVARVRALVEHAGAHVPYYRELFGGAGVTADSIRTLDDLQKLPVTTKAEMRRRFPSGVVADNLPATRRWPCMTSGATGFPLEFYVDLAGLDEILGSYLFFLDWGGTAVWHYRVDLGVRLGRSWQGPPAVRWTRVGRRLLLGEKIGPLLSVDLSAADFRAFVARTAPARGYFVRAYPAFASRLASRLLADGGPLHPSPRLIMTCGETLTTATATLLSRGFGCRVMNEYSTWEALHLAATCPDHPELLHVNPERAVVRVVRADGSPAASGETGRVLLTVFSNYVQPFINYDIGDWAATGTACPCGRGFPTLARVEGRTAEVIRSPSGAIVSTVTLNQLPSLGRTSLPAIWEYQAVQTAPDAVKLRVVPTPHFTGVIAAELERDLRACLGAEMSVTVDVVESIPSEASGKRPIVVPWRGGGAPDV